MCNIKKVSNNSELKSMVFMNPGMVREGWVQQHTKVPYVSKENTKISILSLVCKKF